MMSLISELGFRAQQNITIKWCNNKDEKEKLTEYNNEMMQQ